MSEHTHIVTGELPHSEFDLREVLPIDTETPDIWLDDVKDQLGVHRLSDFVIIIYRRTKSNYELVGTFQMPDRKIIISDNRFILTKDFAGIQPLNHHVQLGDVLIPFSRSMRKPFPYIGKVDHHPHRETLVVTCLKPT